METRKDGRLNISFKLEAWLDGGATTDSIGASVSMISQRGPQKKRVELSRIFVYCSEEGQEEFMRFNDVPIRHSMYFAYVDILNRAMGKRIT